ncbi:unnamed protein product [Alopecurus aequalis]
MGSWENMAARSHLIIRGSFRFSSTPFPRSPASRLPPSASSPAASTSRPPPSSRPSPTANSPPRPRSSTSGAARAGSDPSSVAGQKKTSNFDACRDINGRRLRHVNAERRLEEWKTEAGDRQLEKLVEDFLKKKAKESGRGGVRAAEVDKYLEKYRKDAESCVNVVEESVRASLGKRKAVPKPRDAKKLKICDVDDDEDADTKPIALDDGNCSNGSNKSEDEKVDLASVSSSHSEEEFSGEKSQSIDLEKNGNDLQESMELAIKSGCDVESGSNLDCEGEMVVQPPPENTSKNGTSENGISALAEEVLKSDEKTDVDNAGSATSLLNDPEVPTIEESPAVDNTSLLSEEHVDLAKISSAADLEVLGMENLKLELQTLGLKCGGTLQERAARLFLLKTTTLDKLPKKLLAKPNSGGK